MRILQVHNHYLQPGGEDAVVRNEAALLRRHGHEVDTYATHSRQLDVSDLGAKLRTPLRTVWSHRARRDVAALARREKPDVIHVHNTFPVLSPAVLWAGKDAGVPVVQTLHNYRLACANACLLRDGAPCMDCVGGSKLPAVRHRCYRSALGPSLAVAAMQTVHRRVGTYSNAVAAYVVLTSFMREIMAREGLPEDRLHVSPNFLPDVPAAATDHDDVRVPRRLAFVGRLSYEKGPDLLLDAWTSTRRAGWTLDVVGDGPLAASLRARHESRDDVRFHGWLDQDGVRRIVEGARAIVVPSRWYEGLPMTVVEAYASGRPVVAPDHGGFRETVEQGLTGWRFTPGDPDELRRALDHVVLASDDAWRATVRHARSRFRERYSPDAAYRRLLGIYAAARARTETEAGASRTGVD